LRYVERLEQFWREMFAPFETDLDGAVLVYNPDVPTFVVNHVACVNVDESEVESLLHRVIEYYSSRDFPYVCFRISPITHPKSFAALLVDQGFEKQLDESVMVFTGKQVDEELNPDVIIKEISGNEIEEYIKLFLTIFGAPTEVKDGLQGMFLTRMRRGDKFHLAFIEDKPVGIYDFSSLNRTGGISNIGTLKEYRRRGIGTTLTLHAIMTSINEGNDLHTLQTDKGGYAVRLYEKVGFEIDHTISYFLKETTTVKKT
jgi:GNAT superfamily N-acetyltransferase